MCSAMAAQRQHSRYLIGVDGGGSGTRMLVATEGGTVLARASAGPSALRLGSDVAWRAITDAAMDAFGQIGDALDWNRCVLGCGLAGVNQVEWCARFRRAAPPVLALAIESDAYTTLLGAHCGAPGVIIALGTGSIGAALDGENAFRIAGGYGFPSGDEASGAWLGLHAIVHAQRALDGRTALDDFALALLKQTGARQRDELIRWCSRATQSRYAALAPTVLAHATHPFAARLLREAGRDIGAMVRALDPAGSLAVALCGGLAAALRRYVDEAVKARLVSPHGDSVDGALRLAQRAAAQMP